MTNKENENYKEKALDHYSHHYEYSHQEQEQIYSTGANIRTVDVVVCVKCGNVKRQYENGVY